MYKLDNKGQLSRPFHHSNYDFQGSYPFRIRFIFK